MNFITFIFHFSSSYLYINFHQHKNFIILILFLSIFVRDEYLSSDVVSRTDATSSLSNIARTSNISSSLNVTNNLGICNIPTSRASDEKSDSFIEFKYSGSKMEDSGQVDEVSSIPSSYLTRRDSIKKRRKSSSKIPKVYLYIQMQLCQKDSLREWLCDNLERDLNTVLNMFDQIVQAVEYVHLQGMIHRDLKVSDSNCTYQRRRYGRSF